MGRVEKLDVAFALYIFMKIRSMQHIGQ